MLAIALLVPFAAAGDADAAYSLRLRWFHRRERCSIVSNAYLPTAREFVRASYIHALRDFVTESLIDVLLSGSELSMIDANGYVATGFKWICCMSSSCWQKEIPDVSMGGLVARARQGGRESYTTHAQRRKEFLIPDQRLNFGREIQNPEASLERVDRFVNVLSDPPRLEQSLFLEQKERKRERSVGRIESPTERRVFTLSATFFPDSWTSRLSSMTRCFKLTVPWRTRKSCETDATKS